MKQCKICFIIGFIAVIAIIIRIIIANNEKENYDPRAMGGRKYFGFGREYGYSVDDLDGYPEYNYEVTPHFLCRQGYHRIRNSFTGRDECSLNAYNYGIY